MTMSNVYHSFFGNRFTFVLALYLLLLTERDATEMPTPSPTVNCPSGGLLVNSMCRVVSAGSLNQPNDLKFY